MKNCLITGGSSGIGRAIALDLAKRGEKVYITGTNSRKLDAVIAEINECGGTGYSMIADVRDAKLANQVVADAIEKMGSIDVLVANAGVGRFKQLEQFTDEDYNIQFDVNVKGVFNYLRPVIKYMREQNFGQIIVTSSNLGFETSARCGIYGATKFALQAMIGALREELKGTAIKAGTINPGSVDTPWYNESVDQKRRAKMLSAEDVSAAAMMMINQGASSDIDHILLHPGRQ